MTLKGRLLVSFPALLLAGYEGHDAETVLLAQHAVSLCFVHLNNNDISFWSRSASYT